MLEEAAASSVDCSAMAGSSRPWGERCGIQLRGFRIGGFRA